MTSETAVHSLHGCLLDWVMHGYIIRQHILIPPRNKSGEVSDISALHYSGYDNNFAWSIGAGVRYDITPDIALDLSYRYLDAGKSSLSYKDAEGDKYKSEADVKSHDIMFGVTYNF